MNALTPEYAAKVIIFLFVLGIAALSLLRPRAHDKKIKTNQQKIQAMRRTNQALMELVVWEREHPAVSKTNSRYIELLKEAIAMLEQEVVVDPFDKETRSKLLQLERFRKRVMEGTWNSLS